MAESKKIYLTQDNASFFIFDIPKLKKSQYENAIKFSLQNVYPKEISLVDFAWIPLNDFQVFVCVSEKNEHFKYYSLLFALVKAKILNFVFCTEFSAFVLGVKDDKFFMDVFYKESPFFDVDEFSKYKDFNFIFYDLPSKKSWKDFFDSKNFVLFKDIVDEKIIMYSRIFYDKFTVIKKIASSFILLFSILLLILSFAVNKENKNLEEQNHLLQKNYNSLVKFIKENNPSKKNAESQNKILPLILSLIYENNIKILSIQINEKEFTLEKKGDFSNVFISELKNNKNFSEIKVSLKTLNNENISMIKGKINEK